MVLYLKEGLLSESVNGNEIIKAIDDKIGVLITYQGENNEHTGARYIEPYVYGLTTRNNPAIRAYQYYGDTKKGTPAWKLLRLDRIKSWVPTNNHFEIEPQARGWAAESFNGDDKLMPVIYRVVDLGEEPLTDLEKLQAKTRTLKNSQPVNINQINKTNINQSAKGRQTGPIGNNKPNTGVGNPEPGNDKDNGNYSKPLNTDGSVKNNPSQSPVRQEPKQNGPVVGDTSNHDSYNTDEVMSNEKFMDAMKKNPEPTSV